MKKNLILIVLIFILSIVIIGCQKAITPTPSLPPVTNPTAPISSNGCPTTWKTVIRTVYSGIAENWEEAKGFYNFYTNADPYDFKINITFDKPFTLLDYSPSNWKVYVKRYVPFIYGPYSLEGIYYHTSLTDPAKMALEGKVHSVEVNGKNIILNVRLYEIPLHNFYLLDGDSRFEWSYRGLICNVDNYKNYIYGANLNTMVKNLDLMGNYFRESALKYADVVYWKYIGNTLFMDETGNICNDFCGASDEECCELPVCETCVNNCPLGSNCQ